MEARLLANWTTAAIVVLLMAVMSVLLLPPGWVSGDDAASDGDGSDETGIQIAAWALTVPYILGKGVPSRSAVLSSVL